MKTDHVRSNFSIDKAAAKVVRKAGATTGEADVNSGAEFADTESVATVGLLVTSRSSITTCETLVIGVELSGSVMTPEVLMMSSLTVITGEAVVSNVEFAGAVVADGVLVVLPSTTTTEEVVVIGAGFDGTVFVAAAVVLDTCRATITTTGGLVDVTEVEFVDMRLVTTCGVVVTFSLTGSIVERTGATGAAVVVAEAGVGTIEDEPIPGAVVGVVGETKAGDVVVRAGTIMSFIQLWCPAADGMCRL